MNNIYYVIDRTDDELLIDMGYTNKENEELKQRIDKALKDIDEYKKIFNLDLFSTALENIEAKLRGEDNGKV